MSPARSTARDGMKRKNVFAASGSNVAPWKAFAATAPPVTFAWYQRTVALFVLVPPHVAVVKVPRLTVCATQSDSIPARFAYWACAMALIESTSAALAGVDAFAGDAFGQQFDAACASGPVNVDVEILSQSTLSL